MAPITHPVESGAAMTVSVAKPVSRTSCVAPIAAPATPAGWYDDGTGRQTWYDGTKWTDQYAPAQPPAPQPVHSSGPATGGQLNVKREVIYNRQQKGHSIIKHLLLGWIACYIPTIYYAVSPNHYFHA